MRTYIVSDKDWEVLRKYLDAPGVVLIRQGVADRIGLKEEDLSEFEYAFGGEADVWVDLVLTGAHLVVSEMAGQGIIDSKWSK